MRKLITLIAVCLSLAGVASATMISYDITVDKSGHYEVGTGGNFDLPQFNSSLGTLQSVLLEVASYSQGGANEIDNESTSRGGSATLTIGAAVTVVNGASVTTVNTLPEAILTGSFTTDTDVAPSFDGADYLGLSTLTSQAQDTKSASPGSMNPYIGTGNINFIFSSSGMMGTDYTLPFNVLDLIGPNGVGLRQIDPTYYIYAVVHYTYQSNQDVPEPGTVLLLGGSLLGLCVGTFRRLRRKI